VLRPVAGALNEPEAELIVQQLAAVGISAVSQLSSGNPEFGASGGRTIYVEEEDVERARAALADASSDISDEELAKLSEAAAREARRREG
jgi:Putative prokaryotic signal transducing protein